MFREYLFIPLPALVSVILACNLTPQPAGPSTTSSSDGTAQLPMPTLSQASPSPTISPDISTPTLTAAAPSSDIPVPTEMALQVDKAFTDVVYDYETKGEIVYADDPDWTSRHGGPPSSWATPPIIQTNKQEYPSIIAEDGTLTG